MPLQVIDGVSDVEVGILEFGLWCVGGVLNEKLDSVLGDLVKASMERFNNIVGKVDNVDVGDKIKENVEKFGDDLTMGTRGAVLGKVNDSGEQKQQVFPSVLFRSLAETFDTAMSITDQDNQGDAIATTVQKDQMTDTDAEYFIC
ncbi:hypothetical protein HDU76_008219 [Blyttiomyces sp. JEL0837]|nr:hypothetical protein HDU76_008219 [Blyttiomyces sp. JEL0837]